tara:strand:+ start:166 stop:522 length:357 start_codon:yes stop_codon:yes gene_type:complete
MSLIGSQFLVRAKENKLAIGLFYSNDPENLADMIDEFCGYDGLEYKILDYPINFLMGDFTIPDNKTEEESDNEELVHQQATLQVSESYWNIFLDKDDADEWYDVPIDNTFFSRLYNKE